MYTDINKINLKDLNDEYRPLPPVDRIRKLFEEFRSEDILWTSSFGTTSGILLHMVNSVAPGHPLHFIDTTFCFRKTLGYKDTLAEMLDLNIVNVLPSVEDNTMVRKEELWSKDQNTCCFLNKVKPFEPYKMGKKVWLSGLMMNQTPFRKNLDIFEHFGSLFKMHPNLETTEDQFNAYLEKNNIPPHPMKAEGYDSVGCTHCTVPGKGREGRWKGSKKQECGLHTIEEVKTT